MRVEILEPLAVGRQSLNPGDVIDLTDYSAQKLIDRGLVKKASKPKKSKKAEAPADE